jgi:hypothetical protein
MANKLFSGSLKPREIKDIQLTEALPELSPSGQMERVTLPLTAQQKDLLDNLTRKLSRQRESRHFVVTRNTILRALVDTLSPTLFDEVRLRSEKELTEFLRKKYLS